MGHERAPTAAGNLVLETANKKVRAWPLEKLPRRRDVVFELDTALAVKNYGVILCFPSKNPCWTSRRKKEKIKSDRCEGDVGEPFERLTE